LLIFYANNSHETLSLREVYLQIFLEHFGLVCYTVCIGFHHFWANFGIQDEGRLEIMTLFPCHEQTSKVTFWKHKIRYSSAPNNCRSSDISGIPEGTESLGPTSNPKAQSE